ncbi:Protein of unknown function (DUF3638) [Geosmithia morbida]|uniref:ubiquitinyl hydrolase 1 n=1 Tax=Geosmithia morbida TaxID=1094350 RepID=A0A9P5D6B5_9HYPO|nr:Protein of unknown function (DUF3638) [Geosmithia morbida]KAF4125446.1 Protein of unknown function (DUF3638) [Geosmithia morbida]
MCQSLGGDSLDRYSLERSLHLLEAGAHPVLTCYLAEQNACLLIYRQESGGDEVVVFEAFEAQPPSEDVLAAPNSLRWQFPSRAVQISANDFDNKSFQSSLSSFLEKASSESLVHLAATATKAGRTIPESRNGGSPALITHMLLSILMAIGGPANVCPIDKRVRDDVNFGPGGESSPWRRSPFWLACRVASHRQLELIFGKGPGLVAYKLLMATVLSQLLSDYTGTAMDSSNVVLLQKKLCRRLGKLEKLADEHSSDVAHLLREATITGIFQAHLDEASRYVHSEVSAFKRSTTRRVPFLPLRIPLDAHDFRLSLPSSESYLSDLCASWSRHHAASYVDGPQTVMGDLSYQTGTQETRGLVQNFLDVSREIAKADSKAKSLLPAIQTMHPRQVEEAVISICSILSQLLEIASSSREESPEQNSKLLLAVFDLWTVMDSAASVSCPLLQDYKPPFAGDILDVLHVSSLEDMARAQQELNRKEKTREWEQGCQRYDQYSDGISRNVCRCTYNHDGTKNVNGCNHCYNFRARKRMKISVCEDLLPEDTSKACAIVFELAIPSCIARYRDMTWAIMTQLAYPSLPVSKKQCFLLRKEPFLNKFTQNGGLQPIVSMASVKKSFSKTHYSTRKMKTDLESLLVPLGLDFKLYDSAAKVWVDDLSMPLTLAHWCGLHVPASLTSTVLPTIVHPPTSPQGPSSYEAVSSRLQCPQSISVHEFEAYQRLLSGQSRRWLTMLTELGSPNLNFSKVDTRLLFSGLASQAGPRRPSHGSDTTMGQYRDTVRGVCHSILTDDYFVCRLLEELGKRLDSIRGNWRETQTMGIIVSLTLRIHSFTESDDVRTSTSALLQSSRSTMLDWIQALGRDVRATTDSETARRNSIVMSARDVSDFLYSSVALQQNLVLDVKALPLHDRRDFRQDCVLANDLRHRIREAIEAHPASVTRAVLYGIGLDDYDSGESGRKGRTENLHISCQRFHSNTDEDWMTFILQDLADDSLKPQRIDLNYTEGHLLVGGQTANKLPQDIRDSKDVRELIGAEHLLTYASNLPGMTCRLIFKVQDNEVHFGRRNGRVIIVIRDGYGKIREYVPRHIFISAAEVYDLPRPLVDNCSHWFDCRTWKVECRRSKWISRPADWKLDLQSRQVQRRGVLLADPHSRICSKIADVFRYFADPQRLVVYLPLSERGRLSVELRHLDLSFVVGTNGCLQSRELRAEVDPDQDVGTLYGFQSKIVLRETECHDRRSVRDSAESDKAYGRFDIDDVLGRLTCPPEPLLLFTKAQLHAFTSLPLPDPLTGRTGEEESVHTLTSGRIQPWSELSNPGVEILDQIGHLAPLRTYYPEDKRVLQKTRWSSSLPICMQKDRYKRLAGEIWHKIQRLAMFSPEAKSEAAVVNTYESSLQRRGEIQQLRYECPQSRSPGFSIIQNMDLKYRSSGTFGTAGVRDDASAKLNSAADDVYHIAHVLRSDVFRVSMVRPFRDILHEWPLIGGFHSPFDAKSSSLATLMDAKTLGERWGSFVELCRTSDPAQEFNVMFEEQPTAETLEALISTAYVQEEPLAAGQYLNWTATETTEASDGHLARCKAEGSRMAAYVLHEWPEKTTPTADGFTSDMIIVLDALRSIEPEWERLLRNKALSEYVVEVEKSTDSFVKGKQSRAMGKGKRIRAPRTLVTAPQSIVPSLLEDLATHDIAAPLSYKMETDHSLPTVPTQPEGAQPEGTGRRNVVQPNRSEQVLELRNIVTLFGKSSSTHRSKYSHDLSGSLDALEDAGNMQKEMGLVEAKLPSLGSIQNRISNSLHAANAEFTRLVTAFSSNTTQEADTTSGHGQAWLHQGGQWPRLTFVSMLELLQSTSKVRLGKNVKKSLVSFGCAVANLQRLKRVQRLCQKGHTHRAKEEWQNRGHGSWKPQDNPDWLLLEIDSDILIREEQVEVAREIIAPGKRRNSVLQLNMGKGKFT